MSREPRVERHDGGPGPSVSDQAADAAFESIDAKVAELGGDVQQTFAVVMVMIAGGGMSNATVAGYMPGEATPRDVLDYAVHQLSMLAAECGVALRVDPASN